MGQREAAFDDLSAMFLVVRLPSGQMARESEAGTRFVGAGADPAIECDGVLQVLGGERHVAGEGGELADGTIRTGAGRCSGLIHGERCSSGR